MKETIRARGEHWSVAFCALAALALAMGVGRFAFTPLLPMMQDEFGVTVAQAGWLASANYVGYLAGALCATRSLVRQRAAIRVGLLTIGATTAAMGIAGTFPSWIALRFLPGFASALVLVYVSAWALELLDRAGRPELAGVVYAGVGSGIAVAGGACLLLTYGGFSVSSAWLALGLGALVITAALWPFLGGEAASGAAASIAQPRRHEIPEFWRLVFCYGAFGLGYIIPATFLPVMAKQVVSDPLWFGWAWPVFGAAAIVSTLFAARLSSLVAPRGVWALGSLAMAIGVLVPVALPGVLGIVISALAVGGTFMVNTMAGLQEARRVAGPHARILMAAMTSAFAVSQIAGPLMVSLFADMKDGFSIALIVAAIPLVLAAYTLFTNRGATGSRAQPTTSR